MGKKNKEKKQKAPMDIKLKKTITGSITAIACTAFLCTSLSSAMGAFGEASAARAKLKFSASGTSVSAASSTAASSSGNTSTSNGAESTSAESSSGENYDVPTETPAADPSTPAAPGNDSGSDNKSDVPQTKAEIINYCNTALNNAKAAKVGYTKTFVREGGDNLPSIVAKVISQNKTTTVEKGSDTIKDDFPAGGYNWSSKLRESDVESAELKQNGQYYEITIKLPKETNPGKGEASKYGRVMSVIDANDAKDMVPGVKTVNMIYHDGYVYAKIDAKTGKLVKAEFSAAADISANIALIGDLKADNVTSTETFTDFKW